MISQPAAVVFLKECQRILNEAESKQVALESFVNSHPCGKLYLRYGLISSDYSTISEKAQALLLKSDGNENITSVIAGILTNTKACNGAWVIHYETGSYDKNRETYEFEANSEKDAAFVYATFIYELGMIEAAPEQWILESRGYYSLAFSDLGKNVILYLARNVKAPKQVVVRSSEGVSPSDLTLVEYNDYSTRNTSLLGGRAMGGRNNEQT